MTIVYAQIPQASHTALKNIDLEDHFLYELINGELAPTCAPKPAHQRLSRKLLMSLINYVEKNQLGEMFYSPVNVTLDKQNIPQPDMVFVSKERVTSITEDGIVGPPDAIIEVLSPSSIIRDRIDKMKLYKRAAVPEYWIVDPRYESIEVYNLAEGDMSIYSYAIENGVIESRVIQGFTMEVEHVFK